MEHAVTTGKIVGKRDKGRQPEKILNGLTNWMGDEVKHIVDNQIKR
jgi:hypothetical protein